MATNLVSLKNALNTDGVKAKFADMLGKKSAGFMTSITTVVQNNALLQNADVNSIILAAAQAASLDLPINPNLGFSAIIPFNDKKAGKCVATFQIMRDGWVDLCLRTGQFEYIVNEPVYEGELVEKNRFTDTYVFDESKRVSDNIIGYMAAFKLTNGYKKTIYMTVDEVMAHGKRYSQTFKKGYGLWVEDPKNMALKGLAVDTPIKTYNKGWIEMGEIEKGDIVYDGEGRLTQVIAVSDIKNIPCYKITLLNGQEVVCDEEHDWVIRHKNRREEQINIKELYERFKYGKDKRTVIEPTAQGGFNIDLPIDPYCLGYWIGNGSKCNGIVTCHCDDTEYVSNKFREAGYDVGVSKNSENSDNLHISRLDKTTRRGGFKEHLRNAGVLNNKHIPEIYEMASFGQRIELINGLLDSDGCCNVRKNGTIRIVFSQEASKKHIVDALYRLLCSIGEQPTKPKKYRSHGFGKYVESFAIMFCPNNKLFGVPRKHNKVRSRIGANSWAIKSVEKIDSVPTICIAVDSPSKTYLCTESQIKTHNTVLKLLLKKYAPKSIELVAKAITADQAAFEGSIDDPTAVYVDNDGSKAKADMSDFVEAEEVENAQAEEDKDNTNA